MTNRGGDDARWPLELTRLQSEMERARTGADRDALRGAFWRLLYEALLQKLRFHARAAHSFEPADLEDISSEKALELLARAETGAWSLAGRSASDISGYLSNVARNGWIDHQQRAARRGGRGSALERETEAERADQLGVASSAHPLDRPVALDLVEALRACVEGLSPRGRRAWFFRAYYGMSGREIAAHPSVRLNAPHVDVLVQRTRQALRDCLRAKGHDLNELTRCAFLELWELFESLAKREPRAESPGGRDDD